MYGWDMRIRNLDYTVVGINTTYGFDDEFWDRGTARWVKHVMSWRHMSSLTFAETRS
jgi:hypothetical protein